MEPRPPSSAVRTALKSADMFSGFYVVRLNSLRDRWNPSLIPDTVVNQLKPSLK